VFIRTTLCTTIEDLSPFSTFYKIHRFSFSPP
jgi:hypothetical protein